jgi:hypothetical protein
MKKKFAIDKNEALVTFIHASKENQSALWPLPLQPREVRWNKKIPGKLRAPGILRLNQIYFAMINLCWDTFEPITVSTTYMPEG